jgi:hypothetical protein
MGFQGRCITLKTHFESKEFDIALAAYNGEVIRELISPTKRVAEGSNLKCA